MLAVDNHAFHRTCCEWHALTPPFPKINSIMCIDMIGKIVYCSMDLPQQHLWRCYIFCVRCACVHELQDGPAYMCPLSPAAQVPDCRSFHMLGRVVPVWTEPLHIFTGVSQYDFAADDAAAVKQCEASGMNVCAAKKGCCICVSNSVVSRIASMVRRCEEGGGGGCHPVTYALHYRCFCSRHTPPLNMVHADLFVDDRQLMEFCYAKGMAGGGGVAGGSSSSRYGGSGGRRSAVTVAPAAATAASKRMRR